jgi:hypothetical protein
MLDLFRSDFVFPARSYELDPTISTALTEGIAMQNFFTTAGTPIVKPTAGGADTESFIGLLAVKRAPQATKLEVEVVTVPATSPYTRTLSYTPVGAPQIRTAAGVAIVPDANASLADGEYTISGATITFHSAQAGVVMTVTYKRNLTVLEQRALEGDGAEPGVIKAHVAVGSVGILSHGIFYTDMVDQSAAWYAATASTVVKGGANGLLQIAGTGATVRDAVVLQFPTANVPFVGLKI